MNHYNIKSCKILISAMQMTKQRYLTVSNWSGGSGVYLGYSGQGRLI